jgi:hypothetical protein
LLIPAVPHTQIVFMDFQSFGTVVHCVIENNFRKQFRQQRGKK